MLKKSDHSNTIRLNSDVSFQDCLYPGSHVGEIVHVLNESDFPVTINYILVRGKIEPVMIAVSTTRSFVWHHSHSIWELLS